VGVARGNSLLNGELIYLFHPLWVRTHLSQVCKVGELGPDHFTVCSYMYITSRLWWAVMNTSCSNNHTQQ